MICYLVYLIGCCEKISFGSCQEEFIRWHKSLYHQYSCQYLIEIDSMPEYDAQGRRKLSSGVTNALLLESVHLSRLLVTSMTW